MNHKLEEFFLSKAEPIKSCFLALREILLQSGLKETIKYGMPCYTYCGKALCYLWTDKKTKAPYFLFVDGQLLDHPGLQQGGRTKMKILSIDHHEDLDFRTIQMILNIAKSLRDGI